MTTPANRLQTHSVVGQQLIDKAATLWVEAGEQSDSAEGLGIDGQIALVHDLIALSLTGWAAAVECVIKGPGFLTALSQATEPLPSEIIDVGQSPYPRQLQAKGPFVRVGLEKITIPVSAIGFKPPSLPAGVTQFRLVLKDYRYVGANYKGTIVVTTQTPSTIVTDEKTVTVGL